MGQCLVNIELDMTNPTNKHTEQEFLNKFAKINGDVGIEIISSYRGVDYKIKYRCSHGEHHLFGWQLLKPRKYCCRKGYYEHGAGPKKKSISQWQNELCGIFGKEYNFASLEKMSGKLKFECLAHGVVEQWEHSLRNGLGCPKCIKEKEYVRKQEQARKNFIETGAYLKGRNNVSKAETEWLDKLSVPLRQHLIEETGQTVDGFNKETNTVFLYHGCYWHGCPNTYDPEEIHPNIGVRMKDLYQQTLEYEQRIRDAGYNLVIEWGT